MKKTFFLTICAMVIISLALSCKKGDTGPQGLKGDTGPQGTKGDTGPQGAKGTANVIYSAWFNPTSYKKDTVFSVWGFNYNQPVPAITQSILDSGTVLVFGKMLGYNSLVWPTNQIGQLPITLTYQAGSVMTDTWSAYESLGNLRIRFVNDHNQYNSVATQHLFRYIIIPGGTPTGRMAPLSYKEVCEKYGIPE